jgi:hypothetical protein
VVTVPTGDAADAGGAAGGAAKPAGGGGGGKILLITVTNVQFPVTLEVVYQVPARARGAPVSIYLPTYRYVEVRHEVAPLARFPAGARGDPCIYLSVYYLPVYLAFHIRYRHESH